MLPFKKMQIELSNAYRRVKHLKIIHKCVLQYSQTTLENSISKYFVLPLKETHYKQTTLFSSGLLTRVSYLPIQYTKSICNNVKLITIDLEIIIKIT